MFLTKEIDVPCKNIYQIMFYIRLGCFWQSEGLDDKVPNEGHGSGLVEKLSL